METFKTTFAQLVSLRKQVFLIILTLLIFSCSPEDADLISESETEAQFQNETLFTVSTVISEDNLYGNGQEGINDHNYLITNDDKWVRLMHQLNTVNNVTSTFTETDIDFNEFQVIAVFDDIQESSGHHVNLEVDWNEDNITVNVIKQGPQGIASSVITQPFQIIKIPVSSLPIQFEEIHTTN
ncbi:hypothetical protein DFQ11_10466 [Winogradskyella epiphytica]|uniref:Protease stability complex PrcB-like protein n=1 Tax=Winogradskyella epiphytica TaxID=262005 RepID=A0A2V4WV60_9FLAO|nr:protease complex subunit PrcB family protein [Winogradskyella epiphytica]PYE80700.1 hypothetical protein DFQ11_10466 [Winogradskyella epiphytica]GGW67812.1 hypothetical protein GCM10008085_19620 [Winogradskyella epiphytica]